MTVNLKKSTVTTLLLGFTLCIPAQMALSRSMDRTKVPVKKAIDLTVRKMSAVKKGSSGGNDRVKITVQVMASAASSVPGRVCSGPFKVKVSKFTGSRWTDVGIGGVADLCVGNAVAASTKNLTFTDLVPGSTVGAVKYRAEVDFDNRVPEANEGNNIGGTRYMGH
ncbi:hypothetical protein ACLG6S_13900 [Thermodesulfobacteriota bacterium B35]